MSNHTQGPWTWWTSNSFTRLSSDATGRDGEVAHAYTCSDGVGTIVVSDADAHLIAAAPDLRDALAALLAADGLSAGEYAQAVRGALAALAKAAGE